MGHEGGTLGRQLAAGTRQKLNVLSSQLQVEPRQGASEQTCEEATTVPSLSMSYWWIALAPSRHHRVLHARMESSPLALRPT